MGRWSQQRRRGGGPAAAAAPLPKVITVLWDVTGLAYDLQFDGPIVYDGSGSLDNFTIDGDPVDTCTQASPAIFVLQMSTVTGPGGTWLLSAQPTNLLTPVLQPDTGTVL